MPDQLHGQPMKPAGTNACRPGSPREDDDQEHTTTQMVLRRLTGKECLYRLTFLG
jgi:hypothetical protein